MPPRHTYWTIILEGKPTAFRAHTADELMPTLRQLQARHPDAVMKWFARGRLWHTPEEARLAATLKSRPPHGERRPPAWRPGGEHRDPRDRFKLPRDEKRRRFARDLRAKGRGPDDRVAQGRPAGEAPPRQDRPDAPAERKWPRKPFRPRPPSDTRSDTDRRGERPRGDKPPRFGERRSAGRDRKGPPRGRGGGGHSR